MARVQYLVGTEIFLPAFMFRLALDPTQPVIQWFLGIVSSGVEWPKHDADHSPPFRAEV